ncbi:GTPase-activating protein [Imshaugia aleurites]|uniref:GTPase-activating protein n=1 Tax=Imshaugia aleurites TaxID=172621 RepID=A0A8H3HY81_9LECA|nr:GTPase-activating protein [Imshaugia aleurites]
MVRKVRTEAFLAILKKPIGWFEDEINSTTALVSTLARCSDLEALHVATMALYFAVMVNLIGGSVASFIFAWQLAFVTTGTIPLFLLSAYLRYRLLSAFSGDLKGEYLQAASQASEAMSSTRTVALLRLEDQIVQSYSRALEMADGRSNKTVTRLSLLFGLSQSATFFINALVIWSGAKLISRKQIDTFGFFVAFISISFGAQDAGELFSYAPDLSKARSLSRKLLEISTNDCGNRPLPSLPCPVIARQVTEGQISFKWVSFSYPRRPSAKVLRSVDLEIPAGQHIALVGESGSGKSTVIGLLERFYEPSSGQILIDGQDIRNYDIEDYRSSIGLVSQDPVLYDGSVAFNIALASGGNVTQSQLEAACGKANILDFIQSLPEGFETQIGTHAVMLSGGQRQRIVIARVLLQNAPIFLLDEATSALDFQSEAVVQEALDCAMRGRTTVTVAHRLSTIRRADYIYVFHRGRIVESGNHEELVTLRKRYWKMLMKS